MVTILSHSQVLGVDKFDVASKMKFVAVVGQRSAIASGVWKSRNPGRCSEGI
jgi:hypothetical protein